MLSSITIKILRWPLVFTSGAIHTLFDLSDTLDYVPNGDGDGYGIGENGSVFGEGWGSGDASDADEHGNGRGAGYAFILYGDGRGCGVNYGQAVYGDA